MDNTLENKINLKKKKQQKKTMPFESDFNPWDESGIRNTYLVSHQMFLKHSTSTNIVIPRELPLSVQQVIKAATTNYRLSASFPVWSLPYSPLPHKLSASASVSIKAKNNSFNNNTAIRHKNKLALVERLKQMAFQHLWVSILT